MTTPRIWVGTYGKYNAGSLKGKWFDLRDYIDAEDFNKAIREYHKDEHDPEFMFNDHEGIPEKMISESWLSPAYWTYQDLTEDWGDDTFEAYEKFIEYMYSSKLESDTDLEESVMAFEDSFRGEYDSIKDFAEEYVEDPSELGEEYVNRYFDVDSYTRDLRAEGWHREGNTIFDSDGEEYGQYDSFEKMIEDWLDEGMISKDSLQDHFDYASFGRDLELGGDFTFIDGYVFGQW